MPTSSGSRPAEVFGCPIDSQSEVAQNIRERHWCPFQDRRCDKKSRLIDFPFGVCSAEHSGQIRIICPHRFEEQGSMKGVSKVLEDVAAHYFGDFDNIVAFPEVRLPNAGNIDFVLVRHRPMKPEVEDFVSVEFQSDSTTSTGALVQGITDFLQGDNLRSRSYKFGMNTYDSIKRAITQLMNKGIVYESWGAKCYWVIQEYIYANLIQRYGIKTDGFSSEHASQFALYKLMARDNFLKLECDRFVSTTVDEVYQAMRNNPDMPAKDEFVKQLNTKLQIRLNVRYR